MQPTWEDVNGLEAIVEKLRSVLETNPRMAADAILISERQLTSMLWAIYHTVQPMRIALEKQRDETNEAMARAFSEAP